MKVAFNNLIFNGLKDSAKYQFVYDTIKKTSTNYVNTLTSLNFSSDKNHPNGKHLIEKAFGLAISNLDYFVFITLKIRTSQRVAQT